MKSSKRLLSMAVVLAASFAHADNRPDGVRDSERGAAGRLRLEPSGARVLDFSTLPVVIDSPGVYVLRRDWDVAGATPDPQLAIVAKDVVVDLRGFTLHIRNGGIAVSITGSDVTVRNGRLMGDEQALEATGAATTLEHMTIYTYSGVSVAGNESAVRDVVYRARFALTVGTVSTIEQSDLSCTSECIRINGNGNKVLHNRVHSFADTEVRIQGSGNVLAGNTLTASDATDITFDVAGDNNVLRDNTLTIGEAGNLPPRTFVVVNGTGNVIDGNIELPSADGMRSPTGIRFVCDGNFYGDNRVAALVPFEIGATRQTDWGGNVGY